MSKNPQQSKFAKMMLMLPRVLSGELSLVGRPIDAPEPLTNSWNGSKRGTLYIGKKGLTGLVQINVHDELTHEEMEKYILYYAKNQSLILDLEILLKSFPLMLKKK